MEKIPGCEEEDGQVSKFKSKKSEVKSISFNFFQAKTDVAQPVVQKQAVQGEENNNFEYLINILLAHSII